MTKREKGREKRGGNREQINRDREKKKSRKQKSLELLCNN